MARRYADCVGPGKASAAAEDWIVPTVAQLELAKWAWRELPKEQADEVLASVGLCRIVPLDSEIALAAADDCRRFKLPTADAVIYATARASGADLLTCDTHFRDLPGVILVEKAAPA